MTPQPRVVVITGGGSGIGRGIALAFAARGDSVAIIGRTEATLRATAEELGEGSMWFAADVARPEQVQAAVAAVVARYGRVDVLVNNAALQRRIVTTTPMDEAVRNWDQVIAANLTGVFLMAMAVAPHLKRPGGRIINMSSIGAFRGGRKPGGMAYVAAKSGVHALTHSLARELAPEGITVNGIAPGFILTPMTEAWTPEDRASETAATLVGRPGTPEDIAAAAVYLASPEASFVTGEILNVNGGNLFVH